ncbi:hypothetical protein A2767_01030 [Candidatus Roizmanbacteria bacterium RIFCSPHIGHO2_01_FULL_35_10]|uniref:Transcobalamin-like C-terminal domain-containing protein n=1 Tax=Candidatus Roizmanbacteria bacterium RIFCSPLOWO2_01_FULL_35_13 TaxID=1802055 RepID=A0A1F7IDP6_9BACT|nr:MAG: hypothetical protein A2767_01030 [Candidatus Roizmanbacteria bacterium RIFCSPHIGHO2_01_FULL_35_10]OGK41481.1 MAG: hypothetical protein A3A74_05530 [Candidatus Roizmanbacteria bacterium RIFCSPLOWO2_01_FULL_35_13]
MKKLFLITLVLGSLLVVYKFGPNLLNKNITPKTSQSINKITVKQKIAGEVDFSSQQIEEGKTALDLLKQTGSVVTVGEKENAYVVGVNGIKADEEKKEYWSLYINDKISQVGAGSYKLKNGDKIEWKIETY